MRKLSIVLFLITSVSAVVQAQTIQFNKLYGKTWQVDEFYVDSVRVINSTLKSMKFTFSANNQFSVSGLNQSGVSKLAQGRWTSDSKKSKLMLTAGIGTSASTIELVHLDEKVFAFVIRGTNNITGRQLITELRLRPIN